MDLSGVKEDSNCDSDEEAVLLAAAVLPIILLKHSRPPTYMPRRLRGIEELLDLPDNRFRLHFRLPKALFDAIVDDITPRVESKGPRGTPVRVQLGWTMLHLAAGVAFRYLARSDDPTSASTISSSIQRVVHAILDVYSDSVKLPSADECRLWEIFNRRKFGIGSVAMAMDGTHVLTRPPRREEKTAFLDRHGSISMNVHAVCNPRGKICHLVVGAPGSLGDSTIWANTLGGRLAHDVSDDGTRAGFLPKGISIAGDQAYGPTPYHLCPFRDSSANTPAKLKYNTAQRRARRIIECVFGHLKKRFRCLVIEPEYRYELRVAVVWACCILHNLILEFDDNVPDYWPDDEENLDEDLDLDLDEAPQGNKDIADEGERWRQWIVDTFFADE